MNEPGCEISLRIDFYRNLEAPPSTEEKQKLSSEDYAGSLLIDGARPLSIPRVGEYLFGLSGYFADPLARVTSVVHHVAGVGGARGEAAPSVTAVIAMPWPGDAEKDQMISEFEGQGWLWREAQADRLRAGGASGEAT